ncbi:MAG TPA: hypothetical protein VGE54_10500 [Brevundimonas sp.]
MKLTCIVIAALTAAMAGAASAQTLPSPNDPGWETIGRAEDGKVYSIFPSRTVMERTTVRTMLRMASRPSLTSSYDTIVAVAVVDCASSAAGLGTMESYKATRGFSESYEGPENPELVPIVDPAMLMVIRHVCGD